MNMSIRHERLADVAAREALLDEAFGDGRLRKSSQRLRDGRLPAEGLAFVATEAGRLVGTARLWDVESGECLHTLLGRLVHGGRIMWPTNLFNVSQDTPRR